MAGEITTNKAQVENIFAMMSSGHRCIRMERHSLVLWGVTGGLLCIFTDILFADVAQAHTAVLIFLTIVLSGVALMDFFYSCHRRHAKGETFPFVHAQITKVWWLFLVMGVLFTFGSGFFGGGYMVYGVWLFLLGLGLFVHGLFSEQMLEWAGVLIIFLGIVPLALNVSYEFSKWLAASVFGLGLPALCLLLDGGQTRRPFRRLVQSLLWLLLVLVPPLVTQQFLRKHSASTISNVPVVSLQAFKNGKASGASGIVALPAGTRVPVKIAIAGNIFQNEETIMPLMLARPLEIAMEQGKPSGYFRLAGGEWLYYKHNLTIKGKGQKLISEISPLTGPAILNAGFTITADN